MTDLIFRSPERLSGCHFTRPNNNRFEFLPAQTINGLPLYPPEQ